MKKRVVLIGFLIIFSMFSVFSFVSAGGGATVRVSTIDLTEQRTDYSMKPGRLKFEFEGKLYAIQLRRVKSDYVWFLVMDLDENKRDDITAYTIDDSFNLSIEETREIDIDKNGVNDIFLELNDIISTGEYGSIRSADFSIKKINAEKLEVSTEEKEKNLVQEEEVQEEGVIQEKQEIIQEQSQKIFIQDKEVTIEEDSEGINILNTEEIFVESSLEIIEESQKAYIKTSNGNKELKILPEEAISKVGEIGNIEIKIEEKDGEGVYSISGTKEAKLFFIIPISAEVEQKINVETGEVISVEEPWWSFLATGI